MDQLANRLVVNVLRILAVVKPRVLPVNAHRPLIEPGYDRGSRASGRRRGRGVARPDARGGARVRQSGLVADVRRQELVPPEVVVLGLERRRYSLGCAAQGLEARLANVESLVAHPQRPDDVEYELVKDDRQEADSGFQRCVLELVYAHLQFTFGVSFAKQVP